MHVKSNTYTKIMVVGVYKINTFTYLFFLQENTLKKFVWEPKKL